jgi:hypothetical protein
MDVGLGKMGKLNWAPTTDSYLIESGGCPGLALGALQRDLWTMIILVFWCLSRPRNDVVFNGASPTTGEVKT